MVCLKTQSLSTDPYKHTTHIRHIGHGILKIEAQRRLFCYARKNSKYDTSALKDIVEKRVAAKPLRAELKELIADFDFKEAIKKLTSGRVCAG